jgi:DNA polymerase III delta prime subunit
MELSLICKYQPKILEDFELDDDLKLLIKTFIRINNLNILLIGDSGCGKSSLIKAIIAEYYMGLDKSTIENNILSINSLKEQGISYYRTEVKTFCQTTSAIPNKKKILILDDVDIINEQSQQVFRNCIDKYTANVHFIASCINPQKVIDSLQSRIHILKLPSFDNDKLYTITKKITTRENIELDSQTEKFIITISNNSVRTLINYLEKFKLLGNHITLDIANQVCTNIIFSDFNAYTIACLDGDLQTSIKIIGEIFDKGYSVMDILDNYFLFVKTCNILTEQSKYESIALICKYITIFHTIHEHEIELALFTNNFIQLLSMNQHKIKYESA